MSSSTLTSREKMALAVVAEVAVPTVERLFSGKPIRGLCLTRIRRAAAQLGLSLPDHALDAPPLEVPDVLAIHDEPVIG